LRRRFLRFVRRSARLGGAWILVVGFFTFFAGAGVNHHIGAISILSAKRRGIFPLHADVEDARIRQAQANFVNRPAFEVAVELPNKMNHFLSA
jgi:hypothetical protein